VYISPTASTAASQEPCGKLQSTQQVCRAVVASAIANPAHSISKTERRLVSVQVELDVAVLAIKRDDSHPNLVGANIQISYDIDQGVEKAIEVSLAGSLRGVQYDHQINRFVDTLSPYDGLTDNFLDFLHDCLQAVEIRHLKPVAVLYPRR